LRDERENQERKVKQMKIALAEEEKKLDDLRDREMAALHKKARRA